MRLSNASIVKKKYFLTDSAKMHYKTQHLTEKSSLTFFYKFCKKGFVLKDHMKRHKRYDKEKWNFESS